MFEARPARDVTPTRDSYAIEKRVFEAESQLGDWLLRPKASGGQALRDQHPLSPRDRQIIESVFLSLRIRRGDAVGVNAPHVLHLVFWEELPEALLHQIPETVDGVPVHVEINPQQLRSRYTPST